MCQRNKVAIILGFIFLFPRYLLFSQKELLYGSEILHGVLSNKNIRIPTPQKNRDIVIFGFNFPQGRIEFSLSSL